MANHKKMIFPVLVMSATLALAACGDDEEVTQPVTDDASEETAAPEAESADDASASGGTEVTTDGETYGFTDLSVEVDMPDQDDALDISYEEERGRAEAEYENKIDGVDLMGDDAFNELEQGLSQLSLTPDTPDDDVISQVVEAFGIDPGFKKIEIEVDYADGSDKNYEQTNQ
ncbi:YusW family protein [Planococcus alpniumensis]|uniref:YusW family protein n=1 Tax=Planococcus alpniumensis TaxID=2708345 RepID=UPI001B8BC8C4|nr:YusW family protein [Planococcus sp. MSAK28401]